jgi:hypothetical protein
MYKQKMYSATYSGEEYGKKLNLAEKMIVYDENILYGSVDKIEQWKIV